MSPALWLAVREVAVRRRRAAVAAAVVAALAAATTAIELVSRAREEAVAAQLDAIGPALTVLAPGTTAGALARYDLGERLLPEGVVDEVRSTLGADLRALEARLVVRRDVGGAPATVVGVDGREGRSATTGGALLGSELARRLRHPSTVSLGGRELRVRGALASTGGAEDLAVILPLETVRELAGAAGVNELRVFLRAGSSSRDAEARLVARGLDAVVVRSDRGEVADGGAQAALARHRGIAYAIVSVVAALSLAIASHLDTAERRNEIATLVAIGASRRTVLAALLSRSALVALVGALAGALAGTALAAAQDPGVAAASWRSWPFVVPMLGASLAIGLVTAAPTALATLARDPVAELQEG